MHEDVLQKKNPLCFVIIFQTCFSFISHVLLKFVEIFLPKYTFFPLLIATRQFTSHSCLFLIYIQTILLLFFLNKSQT